MYTHTQFEEHHAKKASYQNQEEKEHKEEINQVSHQDLPSKKEPSRIQTHTKEDSLRKQTTKNDVSTRR